MANSVKCICCGVILKEAPKEGPRLCVACKNAKIFFEDQIYGSIGREMCYIDDAFKHLQKFVDEKEIYKNRISNTPFQAAESEITRLANEYQTIKQLRAKVLKAADDRKKTPAKKA